MWLVDLGLQHGISTEPANDSWFNYLAMPLHQFTWMIVLSVVALHGIVSTILTELMSRTYRHWFLWFLIVFCLPVIGAVTILMVHLTLAASVMESRKQSFWERVLLDGPVSLRKLLVREQARAREVTLSPYKPVATRGMSNGTDPQIDALLRQGRYPEARAHAWKMMEIARESFDNAGTVKYQDYLELIAERESVDSGGDRGADTRR